jgi:hypothetical protein
LIGIIEHILKLRAGVVKSSSSALHGSKLYLDGVDYWKRLFQQSQYEIHRLQAKFETLERDCVQKCDRPASGKRKGEDGGDMRTATRRKTKGRVPFDEDFITLGFGGDESPTGRYAFSD